MRVSSDLANADDVSDAGIYINHLPTSRSTTSSLASQINTSLPPLKPTPPPSPVRRDSTAVEISEEVAALERELTRPRQSHDTSAPMDVDTTTTPKDPADLTSPDKKDRNNNASTSQAQSAEGGEGSATTGNATAAAGPSSSQDRMSASAPFTSAPNRPRRKPRSAAVSIRSPYPVTFRSPSVLAREAKRTPSYPLPSSEPTLPATIKSEQPLIVTNIPSSGKGKASTSASGRAGHGTSGSPKKDFELLPSTEKANKAGTPATPSQPSSPNKVSATPASLLPPPSSPPKALPDPYPPSLPTLPDQVVRNRLNIGGLGKKKARERIAAQNNPQLANLSSSSLNTDLYKLGIAKATHSSVRSLVGQGAPQAGRTRTGGKSITTSDWSVAVAELQTLKTLERIEQLKQERTWSFRQLKKQRATITQKAHWDYLLDEMRWMAVDFKQETRWRIATAYQVVRWVRAWHRAPPGEDRQALCMKTRPPNFLPAPVPESSERQPESTQTTPGSTDTLVSQPQEDAEMTDVVPDSEPLAPPPEEEEDERRRQQQQETSQKKEEGNPQEDKPTADKKASDQDTKGGQEGGVDGKAAADPSTSTSKAAEQTKTTNTTAVNTPASSVIPLSAGIAPSVPEVPRPRRYQHQLMKARAPVFNYDPSTTVFDLSTRTLPSAYRTVESADLVNELFQELPLYGPPPEPSSDPRQNRRIDESSSHHSRITNPSYLLEGKPILVSTLQPARKRKRSGTWTDLSDVMGDESLDPVTEFLTTNPGMLSFGSLDEPDRFLLRAFSLSDLPFLLLCLHLLSLPPLLPTSPRHQAEGHELQAISA